ncbi:MAG: MarR family transcriptional regulator [Nitrospirae bacterium]|nr:MarR family transcriptional regulator [Nitrospirota bacterium]
MLSGTEADIINTVARLKEATKDQLRKEVGFSSDYISYLCGYLVRKGYLNFSDGHYSLARMEIKTLRREDTQIDRELIKEIANEVAGELSGKLRKTVKEIKIPVAQIRQKAKQIPEEKINPDFEFPVEDESLALESNINKIGPNLEKEKSNIDRLVKLFKKIQKRWRKR